MKQKQSTTTGEQHTVIHAICDECGEADVLTIVEHARNSPQARAVSNAHHKIAENHADETGHHVEVGETEEAPGRAVEVARGLAPSVSGADPSDFGGDLQ